METAHGVYFTVHHNVLVLFKGWHASELEVFIPVMIGIALISAYFTATHALRHAKQEAKLCRPTTSISPSLNEAEIPNGTITSTQNSKRFFLDHLVRSLAYLVHATFSTLLMLVVMSYSVWFLVAIMAGSGISHFIFAWNYGGNSSEASREGTEGIACRNVNTAFQEDVVHNNGAVKESVTQL